MKLSGIFKSRRRRQRQGAPPLRERADTLLEIAAETAQFGGWEVDLQAGRVWWSEQVFAIFDMPPGPCPSVEQTIALCTPEHRKRMRSLFQACAQEGHPYDLNLEATTASGRRIWVRAVGKAMRTDGGGIGRVQGSIQDITQQKQMESTSIKVSRRLSTTLDSMGEAFFTLDKDLHFTYLNAEAARVLQRNREDLLGKMVWDEFKEAVGGTSWLEYGRALRDKVMVSFEEYYPPLGRWFEVRCYPSDDGLAVYFHDVTERKQARISLNQAHRALQMLSRCNHVLVRAGQERELIEQICQIAVETGGYRLAWVGYAESDGSDSITIAAHAGPAADDAYVRELALGLSPSSGNGRGPAGEALRTGEPVVVENMQAEQRFPGVLASALAHGFQAAIYLPMHSDMRPLGLLSLYTEHPIKVDPGELRLLQEMADNLAFGIKNIRASCEQQRTQAALIKIAASVSSSTGEHFFEQLAATMAQAVGADGGFVARLVPTTPLTARTVVAVMDGQRLANFDYIVANSPCQAAFDCEHYVICAGVGERYPHSPSAELGTEAYGGWRLTGINGVALGTVFVVFRRRVQHSAFVTSTLQIFAARAAAELERQDADIQMRAQASLLDKAQDAIIVRDMDDKIVFWNKSAERMYGWTREEVMGQRNQELLTDELSLYATTKQITLDTGHWDGEVTRYRKNGSVTTVEVRLSLVDNYDGNAQAILSISTDIAHRKAAEREIERLAFYDPVTALPNRLLLLDRLQHALAICQRSSVTGALLFIDLDHFKTINDTLGHDKGDQLLLQIAQRLRSCVYPSDTLARFGGDEFMVMAENLSEQLTEAARQATLICQKILRSFREPFTLGGIARHITVSIGVTLFDKNHATAGELLKQTDLAMYEVKAAGRNGMRFFDPAMQTEITARAALEADLHDALDQHEFLLHFQPQVDDNGRVTGAEALLRWQSAMRGSVSPTVFIPIAEESGQILALGRWVLENACAQLARWAGDPTLGELCVSVNVSARQLKQPGFAAELLEVLEQTGANPHKLKLEITESVLVADIEATIAMMHAVKAHGIGFSLDDFGTGYSSLSYLKRLPLDQLKVDQSFVRDVLSDPNDAAIAQTVIELGRNLGLSVIAEGVETREQRDFLHAHGCRAFQGYLFCRPLAVRQFEEFVGSATIKP